MEVLSDDEGNVGILLDRDEALILRYMVAIEHTAGWENVATKIGINKKSAKDLEDQLWAKLKTIVD